MTIGRFATASDGTRIHYRVEGRPEGPAVLLSHSLGVTLETWDAQVLALGSSFRILRYDARGHGSSAAPPGPYDIGMLARDALAVLDAEHIPSAHLVGLSMGGMVGMWIGAHAPQRVDKLVLANTTAHIPLRDMWNSRIETALRDGLSSIAAPTLQRWLGEDFKSRRAQQTEAMISVMQAMSSIGYAGCCAALRDADQREILSGIRAPTLVVTGAADLATTPAVAQALADAIPNASCSIIANAGHLSNVEQPEAFNRVIQAFLT